MKIGIDISPLTTGNYLSHRVRGTGYYLTNLLENLEKYFPKNDYLKFSRNEDTPKADVVHIPYFEPFFNTLPFSTNNKTIVTVHDLIPFVFPKSFPAGIKGNLRWKIQKNLLKRSGAIITDSESSKADIMKFTGIPSEKINVVYLAAAPVYKKLEKSGWEVILRKKYNLPEKFVIYVGDATWNKNLPNLIRGAVLSKMPLVVVGKTFKEKNYDKKNAWTADLSTAQDLAENNPDLVLPLGFVPDEDLVGLYNLAKLLLMPSRYEGFGLPLIEAMSCGCPVVTSKRGSIEEVVGDAGLYVNSEDVESIKDGILKVFEDEDLAQKLSKSGLNRVKNFSWEKTAKKTVEIYEKIANS